MALLEKLAAVVFYAATGLGAVSLGYLVLRLAHPETRLLDEEHKLGYSALTGFTLTALALFADAAVAGLGRTSEAKGAFPLALFCSTVFAVLGLRTWFAVHSPRTATIGVPLHPQMTEGYLLGTSPQAVGAASPSGAIPIAQAPQSQDTALVEVAVSPVETVKEMSLAEAVAGITEEKKSAERRKALEEILAKAKELNKN